MKQTIHLLLSFIFIFISNEIEAQNKDQIIRINNVASISDMNTITNPEKGCLVYVQSNGIYYYDGNNWIQNSNNNSTSTDWEMSGNSNATSSHFIGTTNNMGFLITTNNIARVTITNSGYIGIQDPNPQGIFHVNGGIISNYSDDFIIGPYGKVGVGIFPNSYQLAVNGGILADAFTPDYVFENYYSGKKSKLKTDYEFMPIDKAEAFVKEHHHLPGVPSAKDIENQGGILLNKSTEINLEKIEELFLYSFELNKKIESLKKEIEYLELHSQSKP